MTHATGLFMMERNTDFYFATFFPHTLRGKDALYCSTPFRIEMKRCQGKYEMVSLWEFQFGLIAKPSPVQFCM